MATRNWLLSGDFGRFWLGQTISNLGSSFTLFALPLLVFKLTGSPLNLGLATASEYIPYLLFGHRAFFTEAGLAALRALLEDRRAMDPARFAHLRRELGLDAPEDGPTR